MNVPDAIRHMVSHSGKSSHAVCREMGRDKSYIATTLTRGSVPNVDTLAMIAGACGYSVVATGHGETIGVGVPRVAVGSMLRISGRNHREVSRDVSTSQYLIRDIFNDKRGVRANTFAAIAEACGFEVHLVADDGQDDVVLSGDAPWYVRYVYYKDGKPSRVAHSYTFATEDEAAEEAEGSGFDIDVVGHTYYVDVGDDD